MLYGRYLLLKEEEELLKGVRMFPDVFASLYDYLAVMDGFNTSKYSGRYNGRALASCMFKGRELSRILRSLNHIEQDKEVILQSKLAGCEHDLRFKALERKHCLMYHIQQLRREINTYAGAFKIKFPYNL